MSKSILLRPVIGCITCMFAYAAFATREQADTAVVMNRSLNQIVVTGTGTHAKAKDAVVPVQVLTADDLKRNNATTLEQALTMLTPSVTMMTNGMGTTMMMNGLNEDYILILENGKRLTGDDRYTRINMANVKRIEVLSGAASVLYGSEAIGGVINIITEGSNMYSKGESLEHVNITSQNSFTSKGRRTMGMAADLTVGHFSSSTSFQNKQADNWQVNTTEVPSGQPEGHELLMPTGRVMSQGYHSEQVNQRFAWNFSNGLSVYLRGSFYDYLTDRPEDATYYKYNKTKKNFTETAAYTYDLSHQDYLYGAGTSWKINSSTYLEADFYSDNLTSKRDSFDIKKLCGEQLTKRTHYYNGTLKGIFRLGEWNKLSAGMEYVHETYESYNFNYKGMYTISAYAQDEMNILHKLKAVLGLRYIYNENFGSYATPNVALMYSPGPVRIRTSYSTGYRTPTLVQMFYENEDTKSVTLGNKDLKPEKSNFYNLGVEYNNYWVSAQVGAFYNDVRGMISYRVLTNDEAATLGLDTKYPKISKFQQRDNIDKAKVKGLHLSATFYLPKNIRLGGAYTLSDTKAETVSLNTTTQQYEVTTEPTDRSVKHSGRIFAGWLHNWKKYTLDINMNGHLQGERWSTSYGYAPAYSQFDLNTTHTFRLKYVDLIPGLGIENIFNKRDTRPWCSNFSTLHPGRCMYVSFNVKFKK